MSKHPVTRIRAARLALSLGVVALGGTGLCASAQAMTLSQYGHNIKEDAAGAGHAIVRVGKQTGHGVVHAAKTVGHDVAGGVKHGYHATKDALSKKH